MRQFIADVHNRSEEGATAAEYVFLLVFIAIAATVGMALLGQGLMDEFRDADTAVSQTNTTTTAPTAVTN